ncbi:alpha/beta hydrolase [Microbacterium sp. ASV49]|uniref:Alpha/beta hydrolase n=1 Tax=Microbacterium candidum TaxID=3041922 RepID=A0ABT7MY07_9MICO|nr:alpha/beta hydrolase [Microbacterium sp. ASV49]MDL9979339.1 alpha/beta hydrolase [Microbacterium sp. ASV49]
MSATDATPAAAGVGDETRRLLALLNETFPDIASMEPLEARTAVDARIRPAANLDDVASTTDEAVGTDGVTVRVYRPHDPDPDVPATVYVHGGGFLHGSVEGHDSYCRSWARAVRGIVVSVDHRRAPDVPAPVPLEDVIAAVDWVRANGFADAGVVIAGDSSGGNLAAGAALALRDRSDSPLVGQVLLYPFLDPTMSSPSYERNAEGYFITARILDYYWQSYLGETDRDAAASDPRISPPAASSLAGLPPAIVVTGGRDPLCDEGRDYADALRDAGVPVIHHHFPEQFHGFATIPGYGPGAAASAIVWSDFARMFTRAGES